MTVAAATGRPDRQLARVVFNDAGNTSLNIAPSGADTTGNILRSSPANQSFTITIARYGGLSDGALNITIDLGTPLPTDDYDLEISTVGTTGDIYRASKMRYPALHPGQTTTKCVFQLHQDVAAVDNKFTEIRVTFVDRRG